MCAMEEISLVHDGGGMENNERKSGKYFHNLIRMFSHFLYLR